ncbi:hypothetical protein P280DRAFT_464618 [Massarina eburnea CBS 473.64]|uniref:Uncharacterized protein n=1 Tax=Massarina eburnea CBS 473.64 TaxID=1395130 RepID=A0A6A6SER3_9PLEO|nr:hypothetical protein P280DRAFT_464618 [Massarina eburnea CBS 473.64]
MPPVSQFPPARVFLKNMNIGSIGNIAVGPARRASLTSNLMPRYTTTSLTTSQLVSRTAMQLVNGTTKSSGLKGSATTA